MTNLHPVTQDVIISLLKQTAPPYLLEQLKTQPDTLIDLETVGSSELLDKITEELNAVLG